MFIHNIIFIIYFLLYTSFDCFFLLVCVTFLMFSRLKSGDVVQKHLHTLTPVLVAPHPDGTCWPPILYT